MKLAKIVTRSIHCTKAASVIGVQLLAVLILVASTTAAKSQLTASVALPDSDRKAAASSSPPLTLSLSSEANPFATIARCTPTKIVEAENCDQEPDCTKEGAWKPWQHPVFSNGWLLTNEHETKLGTPVPVTFTLSFTGTAFSIVYRQDTWYGMLGVGIDGQDEYYVNQQGAVENQAEACFEVDKGRHSITLTGGLPTSVVTGVITLDAIKIFDGEECCGEEETLCGRGMIVPAYFDPCSSDGSEYWSQLAEAAKKVDGKLIAIVNVDNGPGTEPEPCYSEAISSVVSNGGKVIGYIHTCYGNQTETVDDHPLCPKTEISITTDIDMWYDFYREDGLSGIFFDEVSSYTETETVTGLVPYYQRLYDYVQDKQPGAIVVNHFGAEPYEDYSSIGSSVLCTFEGPFSRFVGWSPPSWITRERSCALVYDTPEDDLATALKYLAKKNVGWFYFTSDINGILNPWDTLPPYFPDLVDSILCKIYLPIVRKYE